MPKHQQKGEGIITAMIVIAVIAIMAIALGTFFNSQNKTSKNLQLSGSCESIASSFHSYLLSTSNDAWINSIGPNTISSDSTERMRFPSVSSVNTDGLNRYYNLQESIISYAQPLILSNSSTNAPAGFKSINYLNRNNSFTRLITLARLQNVCFNNFNNSDEGTVIYSNVTPNSPKLAGIPLSEPDTEIRLKVDFIGLNLCDGSRRLNSLPQSDANIRYKVDVTTGVSSSKPKKCSSEGTIAAQVDTSQPLTLTRFSNVTDCPATPSAGAHCFHGLSGQLTNLPHPPGTPIFVNVQAVRNDNTCRNCLQSLSELNCSGTGNTVRDAQTACSSVCFPSEPGSIFFCRLANAQSFSLNPSNVPWWPCHAQPNNVPGNISISYTYANPSEPQSSTSAMISISGLPSARNYYFDVRALDSYGKTFGNSLYVSMPNLYNNMNVPECSCNKSCIWNVGNCSSPGTCTYNCCNQANATPANNCSRTVTENRNVTCTVQCQDPTTGAIIADGNSYCPSPAPNSIQTQTITCSPVVNNALMCGGAPPAPFCGLPVVQDWGECSATLCGQGGTRTRTLTCKNPDGSVHTPASDCPNSCVDPEPCFAENCPACVFPSDPNSGWGACQDATCDNPGQEVRAGVCELNGAPATGCDICEETRECFASGCQKTCDFTGISYGACAGACGTQGIQNRTGACKDENGNPATGCPNNCEQEQQCTVECTSSCNYDSATWGSCDPTCPSSAGNRTRTGACLYSDGTASNSCSGGCVDSEPCTNSCAQPTCEWNDWGTCSTQDCNSNPPTASQRTRTQSCMLNGQPSTECTGGCTATETTTAGCDALNCPSCAGLSVPEPGNPQSGNISNYNGYCSCENPPPFGGPCTIEHQGRMCPGTIENHGDGYCGGNANGDCHSCVCYVNSYCNSNE